jgi:DNA polymerase V
MRAIVETIYKPDSSTRHKHPLFKSGVSAGFPSPAADYEEGKLDLNRHLVRNPAATFFVRVNGDSMIGAGVHTGDLLVVDRSLEPADKSVVIAVVNGELTVKRIRMRKGKITLEPENEHYPTQQITECVEFEVWGVVTNLIHAL